MKARRRKLRTMADAYDHPGVRVETMARGCRGLFGTGHVYRATSYQDITGKVRAYGMGGQIVHLHPETPVREVIDL